MAPWLSLSLSLTALCPPAQPCNAQGSLTDLSFSWDGERRAPRDDSRADRGRDDHARRVQGEPLTRNLPFMTVALLGAQVGTLGVLSQLPSDVTNWGEGSFDQILQNDLRGPKWDTDGWGWNYLAHPVVGSEYYLLARNRGANWWQSLSYSVAMSTFWELFTEAYYERPSRQDLLITPLAGSLLGELRYQARTSLRPTGTYAERTWKKVAIVALDPVEALTGGGL